MAVLGFGSSDALAGAYGIAVSLLMAITTLLAALVALQWGYNPVAVVALNGFFLVIDLLFFAANSPKLFEGGWFPLLLAFGVAFLMLTWRTGQRLVERARHPAAAARADVPAQARGEPAGAAAGHRHRPHAGRRRHPALADPPPQAQPRHARAAAAGLGADDRGPAGAGGGDGSRSGTSPAASAA